MPDLSELIANWGYLAIFVVVVFGNFGVPVPEETILALAGYMAWQGTLRLPIVLVVAIISAVAGDNLGYWFGREYGRGTLVRYGPWVGMTAPRFEKVSRLVKRHGFLGVFGARFVPGLRFMAGPVAGASGVGALTFATANVLGALVYAPYAVGLGYAIGYGLGPYVERLRHAIGEVEHLLLIAVALLAATVLGWRALRVIRAGRPSSDRPT